jgi:hypothetical protein
MSFRLLLLDNVMWSFILKYDILHWINLTLEKHRRAIKNRQSTDNESVGREDTIRRQTKLKPKARHGHHQKPGMNPGAGEG